MEGSTGNFGHDVRISSSLQGKQPYRWQAGALITQLDWSLNTPHPFISLLLPVLWIRDFLVPFRIRIRGSVTLTYESEYCSFRQ